MPVIGLREWDPSETLAPYDPGFMQNLKAAFGLIGNIVGSQRKVDQNRIFRKAIKEKLGIDIPIPVGTEIDISKDIISEMLRGRTEKRKATEGWIDKAATKGWNLNVASDLSPGRQAGVARQLFAGKVATTPEEIGLTEEFRNDFKSTIDAVNKINELPITTGKKRKRTAEAWQRLKDAYPDKAATIEDYINY